MSDAIRSMFDAIAGRYDTLNRTLSAGRDVVWRRNAAAGLPALPPNARVLDLCGGTGDFCLSLRQNGIQSFCVLGDFSKPMLEGSKGKSGLSASPTVLDALNPPFQPGTFDLVLCGFGMRNLDNLQNGIETVHSLLKPGGVFLTLEFYRPETFFTRFFYGVLAPVAIPFLGRLMGSKREAYEYLVKSVQRFRTSKEYAEMCRSAGFENIQINACDFGIAHAVMAAKAVKAAKGKEG